MTSLGVGEAHVWTIRLDASERALTRFLALLSPDEQARRSALRGDRLQRRYTVLHGALRLLLEGYTGRPAAAIVLTRGRDGKPQLEGDLPVHFNISDCGEVGMYAFADGPVGIDVEEIRPVPDHRLEPLARLAFCAAETAELQSLAPAQRLGAFYRGWTRKEAYSKAVGAGLAAALARVHVSLAPDEARILGFPEGGDSPGRWTLHHLEPGAGYVGALAYRGAPRSLRLRPACAETPLARPAHV
ncbi:MAG TPA: 4'-phosphopantetheinyl transferase superfamily protein [Methylomirabilota bacterium]